LFIIDVVSITSLNVNITPIPGDVRSPAYAMFKELSILAGKNLY